MHIGLAQPVLVLPSEALPSRKVHLKQNSSWLMDPCAGTSPSTGHGVSCTDSQCIPLIIIQPSAVYPGSVLSSPALSSAEVQALERVQSRESRETSMNNAICTWLTFQDFARVLSWLCANRFAECEIISFNILIVWENTLIKPDRYKTSLKIVNSVCLFDFF